MRHVCFVMCLLSVAAVAETRPTIGPAPLQIDPAPLLMKVAPAVRQGFADSLSRQKNLIISSTSEMEMVAKKLGRTDLAESDEGLAALATKADVLYGLYVVVTLTEGNQATREMIVTGRVVRSDGKKMKNAQLRQKAGSDPFAETAKVMFGRLLNELALQQLPATKEDPKPVELVPVVVKPIELKPAEVKTVEVKVASDAGVQPSAVDAGAPVEVAPAPSKTPAWILVGVGAAVAVGGGVLMGVGASRAGTATEGLLNPGTDSPADAVAHLKEGQMLHTIGAIGLGVGAAAVAGGIVWAMALPSAPVQVSVVPREAGATLSVSGVLP